jgi:hypothetical protein
MISKTHRCPNRVGQARAPRTPVKGWNDRAAKAERRELSATTDLTSLVGRLPKVPGRSTRGSSTTQLKSVLEPSVRRNSRRQRRIRQCDLDWRVNPVWSVRLRRARRRLIPSRRRPGLPGAQSIAYRTTNPFCVRGNLASSAGHETPGKPPSPVMTRPRGRASVVVRARESRVHGEGRQ